MVDFILWTFWIATFALGFWCGKTFNTVGAALDAGAKKLTEWWKSV